MNWNDAPECERCYRSTYRCEVCQGDTSIWSLTGRTPCTECDETGWLCPNDGKFWKK
jgi:hypothetical protein